MSEEEKDPNIFQIIHSLLASFFGVQSEENLARDEKYIEKYGIKIYIIIGFSLVFILLLSLFALVQIIVHYAT